MTNEIENPMVVDSLWRRYEDHTGKFEEEQIDMYDDEIFCATCRLRMVKQEAIESERWEDYYLCEKKECADSHYKGWECNMSAQKYYIANKREAFI